MAEAWLCNGQKITVEIKGFRGGLIWPHNKIKQGRNAIEHNAIKKIIIRSTGEEFITKTFILFGEKTTSFFKALNSEVYIGAVRYRAYTCNGNYRTVRAYHLNKPENHIILRHHIFNKVDKRTEKGLGLTPEVNQMYKLKDLKFSEVPEKIKEL